MSYHEQRLHRTVGFLTEWYDASAGLVRTFKLIYTPDSTVQLIDIKTNKTYLSKTFLPSITPSDLYVGGSVSVFSRQLHITGYADQGTKDYVDSLRVGAFFIILPGGMDSLGDIVGELQGERTACLVSKMRMLGTKGLRDVPEDIAPKLPQSGAVVAVEVIMDRRRVSYQQWAQRAGALRARYGEGALVYSSGASEASEHSSFFFSPCRGASTADLSGRPCTLCIIKPHVVKAGKIGEVLQKVRAGGFEVSALDMFHLEKQMAAEFLAAYKPVFTYYSELLERMTDGPVVALQITAAGSGGGNKEPQAMEGTAYVDGGTGAAARGVVDAFRELCGPVDPQVAQAIRPSSIRALLGEDRPTNAVHCTDLPEDGLLECQYFFRVLSQTATA